MEDTRTYEGTTICAQATAAGRGAIAIIRISGPQTRDILTKTFFPVGKPSAAVNPEAGGDRPADGSAMAGRPLPAGKMTFGTVRDSEGNVIDEVMAVFFKAPHSYTGEDSAEIYCHGSQYIVAETMQVLMAAGAKLAGGGEFTQRAFLNGKMDLAQAEAVADLIASETRAAHDIALNQMRGGYSGELGEMRRELVDIVSLMELELDFSEEDVEFADREKLRGLVEKVQRHISSLTDSFRYGNAIKNGIPVAIIGAVNTGKSTLLNALLKEDRAIVSDIAGTTRDTVEDTVNIGGTTFRFIDTAGIRSTRETIEIIGIERTFTTIRKASVILMVLDATKPEYHAESLTNLAPRLNPEQQLFILLNKCDLTGSPAGEAADPSQDKAPASSPAGSLPENPAQDFTADTAASKAIDALTATVRNTAAAAGLSPIAVLPISAKHNNGIEALTTALSETSRDLTRNTGGTLVSNLRHYEALKDAQSALDRVSDGLTRQISTEFISQDIREALYHIGTITGEISTDEILRNIFGKFCIGK